MANNFFKSIEIIHLPLQRHQLKSGAAQRKILACTFINEILKIMAKKCQKMMATKSSEAREREFTATARELTDEEVMERFAKMGL